MQSYFCALTKKIVYENKYYKQYTDLLSSSIITGSDSFDAYKRYKRYTQQIWIHSLLGWVKFNADATKSKTN